MSADPRLVTVAYGPPARAALAAALDRAQSGDPLAAVTVVVPSAIAGVTLRRRLAAERGLANVQTVALAQLTEKLAAPALASLGRPRLTPLLRRALVRAVVAETPGRLGESAAVSATESSLVSTIRDLAEIETGSAGGLDAVAAQSQRAADVVGLYRRFREAARGFADDHDAVGAAVQACENRLDVVAAVGTVVVHLPRRLGRPERILLAAVARTGRLRVLVGLTGVDRADEPAHEMVAHLRPLLGAPSAPTVPVEPAGGHHIVRAVDPAEEAAIAVRLISRWLDEGVVSERIAVAYRQAEPYGLLLREQFKAAGLAHHGPPGATLAQSVAGRTLVGLLSLPDSDFRRTDVMALLRAAPVIERGWGPAPVGRWERLAVRAGVAGGLGQWRDRLSLAAERERPLLPPDGDEVTGYDRLLAFVDGLSEATLAPPRRSWAELAGWAEKLLLAYLGGRETVAGWPESEQLAHGALLDVLQQMSGLDGYGVPADLAGFRKVLGHELDRPGPAGGRFGHGVAVLPIADAAGADFDRLVVVGMAEGSFPPRPSDDPLLPERERRAAGLPAAGRRLSRADEERDYLAALASASHRVLCFPASDPRRQRDHHPCRWLLDSASRLMGRRLHSGDLAALRSLELPWYDHAESFEWWLAGGRSPATPAERDWAALLAAHRSGWPVESTAWVQNDPSLARGMEAVRQRGSGEFGRWTGRVGSHPALADDLVHPVSATALEEWATCPFRWFLHHGLGVHADDDVASADTVHPLDRGRLIHAVLEAFMSEHLGRPPDAAWTVADHRRLLDLAETAFDRLEAAGCTGRPLLWELEKAALRRQLRRILDADSRYRAERGMVPHAVEHGFGGPDAERVEIEAGGHGDPAGVVRFRGRIDRIDRSADGRRIVVLDYKTGRVGPAHQRLEHDVTAGGALLQLPVYAHAAQAAHRAAEVEAYYWFVGAGGPIQMKGGAIDGPAAARFRAVLATIADGIRGGRFPARPGAESWRPAGWTQENCATCPYDRVCPTGRGVAWARMRHDPELAGYAELVGSHGDQR